MKRAVALVMVASCSWIAVDPPPRHPPPGEPVTCDAKHWAPASDLGVFGAVLIVGLLSGALSGISPPEPERAAAVFVPIGVTAGVFGASGYYGLHQLRRCRSLSGLPLDAKP